MVHLILQFNSMKQIKNQFLQTEKKKEKLQDSNLTNQESISIQCTFPGCLRFSKNQALNSLNNVAEIITIVSSCSFHHHSIVNFSLFHLTLFKRIPALEFPFSRFFQPQKPKLSSSRRNHEVRYNKDCNTCFEWVLESTHIFFNVVFSGNKQMIPIYDFYNIR